MSAPYGSLVRYLFPALLLHGECGAGAAAGGSRPAGCPEERLWCEGASVAGPRGAGGALGRRWVRGRGGAERGWGAGSPRWLCPTPICAAARVGAAPPAGVKPPRCRAPAGGLCCSPGLLGWSSRCGHLTQSFFTRLRARAGAAELWRVWPRHPAGPAFVLLSGKVFCRGGVIWEAFGSKVCQHRILCPTKIVLLQNIKFLGITTRSPALTV